MNLNPYILKENEPICQLFVQIPHITYGDQVWRPHITGPTRTICLDILQTEDTINVLLGCPDWEPRGLANYIEVICSNLRMLMKAYGLLKDKMSVCWFEIDHTRSYVHFESINFEEDDGIWLSSPGWTGLLEDQLPFNVNHYLILPQKKTLR